MRAMKMRRGGFGAHKVYKFMQSTQLDCSNANCQNDVDNEEKLWNLSI